MITDKVLKEEGKDSNFFKKLKGKPLILSFSFYRANKGKGSNPISDSANDSNISSDPTVIEIKKTIDEYQGNISAVMWDFEYVCSSRNSKGNIKCSDQETAARMAYLKHIHSYANSKNLPFGIVTFPGVNSSSNTYGVEYKGSSAFADFLMPMLYCQWTKLGSCSDFSSSSPMMKRWSDENKKTSRPTLIPLIAIKTTGAQGSATITADQLKNVYSAMDPKPKSIGYWNTVDIKELESAIKEVENSD